MLDAYVRGTIVSEPDSQPKGARESGTVAYMANCSLRNFRWHESDWLIAMSQVAKCGDN